jgi:hypothetical protein
MNANPDHFAFEAVLRESAAAAAFKIDPADMAIGRPRGRRTSPGSITAFSVFAGLGLISAIIFVTGYSALMSDTPGIWIHRLMALTVAQSILIAAVAMKLLPLIERRYFSVRIGPRTTVKRELLPDRRRESADQPQASIPAPPPRKPTVGGKLAGREFLQFDDGSIEINTLVGRRRFVSLDAAREFVGA